MSKAGNGFPKSLCATAAVFLLIESVASSRPSAESDEVAARALDVPGAKDFVPATEAVNTHLAKTAKEVSSKAKEAAALAGTLAQNLATYHKEMGVMANLVKNVEPYKDHVKEVVRGLEMEEDSRIEALNMDVNKVGLGDTGDDVDMM